MHLWQWARRWLQCRARQTCSAADVIQDDVQGSSQGGHLQNILPETDEGLVEQTRWCACTQTQTHTHTHNKRCLHVYSTNSTNIEHFIVNEQLNHRYFVEHYLVCIVYSLNLTI